MVDTLIRVALSAHGKTQLVSELNGLLGAILDMPEVDQTNSLLYTRLGLRANMSDVLEWIRTLIDYGLQTVVLFAGSYDT